MKTMNFTEAIDDALAQAIGDDARIILFGEDVPLLRRNLLVRFGLKRVRGTPISESAFLGAGVAAAMAGLRPVVELYLVDFLGVVMDALLNHAGLSKVKMRTSHSQLRLTQTLKPRRVRVCEAFVYT